jgi:hypothetical protein
MTVRDERSESSVETIAREAVKRWESNNSYLEQVIRDAILAGNDALLARNKKLTEVLQRIARPLSCGCNPCVGQCTSQQALRITVDEMQELSRAALAADKEQANENN